MYKKFFTSGLLGGMVSFIPGIYLLNQPPKPETWAFALS